MKIIESQCESATTPISVSGSIISFGLRCNLSKSVFLVGGFAASDWLFNTLKSSLANRGLDVSRPDQHT